MVGEYVGYDEYISYTIVIANAKKTTMNNITYKQIILTLTIFFASGLLFANSNDSLTIQRLTEKITLLENKVEVLNDTNNKFITISWAVIGIIAGLFAVVIGLNFWSSYKINSQKIDNIKDELKSYLETELFTKYKDKSEASIKSLISNELSSLKHTDKLTEHKIREIHIQLLKKELEEYTGEYGYYKIDKLISLLKLSIEVEIYHDLLGNSVGVHDTLKLILDFVKTNKIEIDDKKRLLENLSKLNEKYKYHVDEIEKNIQT